MRAKAPLVKTPARRRLQRRPGSKTQVKIRVPRHASLSSKFVRERARDEKYRKREAGLGCRDPRDKPGKSKVKVESRKINLEYIVYSIYSINSI